LLSRYERAAALAVEFALYAGCCVVAYRCPEAVSAALTESFYLSEALIGVLICGSLLMFVVLLQIRIYRNHQSQIRELNRELEAQNEQLNSLNRMKTEFLQYIKHEIKNPLLVISLSTDLIRTCVGEGEKETLGTLSNIQNEALRLGRMINGMVELATMSGHSMIRDKADFAALLKTCAETSRLPIEKKNNKLHINIAPGLPPVYIEAEQFERVPINLLTNAMECTQGGEITLEASVKNDYITVRVRDTGEGVPPEILPRIFERGVSGKGGKGYGLAICKTIVEAHGGEIGIESERGKGTTVTFTIPVYSGQNEARRDEL
jgi:signal transduction histidine kinase